MCKKNINQYTHGTTSIYEKKFCGFTNKTFSYI